MRLLCLTPRLPWPPDRGDRLRAYHLLATFAREHEVTLLTAYADRAELAGVGQLEEIVGKVVPVRIPKAASVVAMAANAWRELPLQALYYRSGRFRRALAELRPQSFDAIYLHLFRLAPYILPSPCPGVHRIVDLTDVISSEIERSLPFRKAAGRWLYRAEGRRIAAFEERLGREVEEIWVVSEAERRALLSRCPEAPVRVVPNGVDLDRFKPAERSPEAGRILFVGHMDVAHNIDAAVFLATEVLPRVRRVEPRAHLRLVGAGGDAAIERLNRLEGVEWAGFVPALEAELQRAEVFVAPLRFSAGLQNKVLEAMATGRPVVTTAAVQRGLEATHEVELLVGDGADSLAAETVRLLRDGGLAARLGRAAREHVRRRFDWRLAAERLRELEAGTRTRAQRL